MTIVSFSTGLGALNSINQIQRSEHARTNSIAKISSSLKIRKAADSVADSAIGTKIKVEISSLKQILVGTAQAQSALNIAEGALNELTNTVMRMNTLAKQSVNGSNSDDDRAKINLEYQEIMKEVDRIADSANFNSKKLLAGTKTIINDSYDNLREEVLGQGGLDDRGNYKKGGGFDSIKLDSENSSFVYQITYDKDTQMMKVENRATGQSEERKLSRDVIADKESVSFTKMDLKVTLNQYFNKNASIGAQYASGVDDNNYKLINKVSSAMTEVTETPKVVTVTAGKVKVDANDLTFAGSESLGKDITDSTSLGEFKTILGEFGGGGTTGAGSAATLTAGTDVTITSGALSSVEFSVSDTDSTVDSFKISSVDSKGLATFEAKVTLKDTGGTVSKSETIKGTMQLVTSDATDVLDKSSKMITYSRDGMVTADNKTYELKTGEYVSEDGNVKDIFGQDVGVKANIKDSGIDANNYKIFVSGGNGIAGDLTDLGVYMTGTNGAAKFVIHAADGDFVSEGTYDLTDEIVANKDKNGSLELKAGLNEIVLSRKVQETDQKALSRDKDTIKISIMLDEKLNKIDKANSSTNIDATNGFLNGKGIADENGTENNTRIAVLNEMKNSKMFYQEVKDTASFDFRVGTGSTSENVINLSIKATTTEAMNIKGTDVLTVDNANDASKKLQAALDYIQEERAKVGVTDNRIEFANNNINTTITNSQSAVSAIFDLDVPTEIAELSQTEMKQTASIESLSRDMRSKQSLLKLF